MNITQDSCRICVGEWEKTKTKMSGAASPASGKFPPVGHHVGGGVLQTAALTLASLEYSAENRRERYGIRGARP